MAFVPRVNLDCYRVVNFSEPLHLFDSLYLYLSRVRSEVTPTLSPSYRILLENVDRSTDYGGSPNPFPLHLKCLSISGLPVDEIPCVEVWDMSGLVFNSHSGLIHSSSNCAWSSEYGDGFFQIGEDILGDFSIMCRFGGSHALTRDKTTLIFKYQNSTGKAYILEERIILPPPISFISLLLLLPTNTFLLLL
jgi:hypothetical protein